MPDNYDQANGQPTETSPLLAREEIQAVEVDGGITPEAPYGTTSDDPDSGAYDI
jgi:hypothetical protein